MNKIKLVLCCLLFSLCFFAQAGTFTKLDISKDELKDATFILFTGEIVKEDEDKFQEVIDKYKENIYIVLNSNGGLFLTGIKLGTMTALHDVHIIVEKAYSAAGFWAYADKSRHFLDEESELGLHLPYNEIDENPGDSMFYGAVIYAYLHDIGEVKDALSLISELGDIRKKYGTHGMIVFTKKEKKIVH